MPKYPISQRQLSDKGILCWGQDTLIQKCPIVELEVAGVDFGQQQLNSIVTSAKKLRVFWFGRVGFRPSSPAEKLIYQNVIKATEGRVVICLGSLGLVPVKLSGEHQRNYEDLSIKELLEKANQREDPMICNKVWDGFDV